MPEDKVSKIYELYKSNGLVNKISVDEFRNADANQQKKIYDLGKKKNLIKSVPFEEFSSAFTVGGGDVGKPIGSEEPVESSEAISPSLSQSSYQQVKEEASDSVEQFEKTGAIGRAATVPQNQDFTYIGGKAYSPEGVKDLLAEKYNMFSPAIETGRLTYTNYTPSDVIVSYEEQLKEIKREKAKTSSTGGRTNNPIERNKFKELSKEESRIEGLIKQSKDANNDVIAKEVGAKYTVDGEDVSFSEINNLIVDGALKDSDVSIEGDESTKALYEFQQKALEDREGKMFGQETAEDFLANAFELAAGVAIPMAASSDAASLMGDMSYEDKMLAIKKGVDDVSSGIRGRRPMEKDAIDKIKEGDVVGGVSDFYSSFVGSLPYMALASTGVGTGVLAESLAMNKYLELRNEGVDKSEALAGAIGSSFVNSIGERVGMKLMSKAFKPVVKMKNGGVPISAKPIKEQIKKNLKNATLGEASTEYIQEGSEYAIDQIAKGKDVDWIEFNRRGMLGAGSALVGGGSFAALGSGVNYYFAEEQAAKNRKKAIDEMGALIDASLDATSDTERESMVNQARRIAEDLEVQAKEIEDRVNKATPEEKLALDEIQAEIADLNNIDKVDTSERLAAAIEKKDELIRNISEEQTDETAEQESQDIALQEGKAEMESIKEGITKTTSPVKIFKGLGGKKDLKGARINAHEGAKGIFTAVDEEMAKGYARGEGMAEFELPAGTTVEVVEVDGTGMSPTQYREAEVEAINNSDADVVKLITVDGKIKAGTKKQEQYVIKNENLYEQATAPTQPTTQESETVQSEQEVVEQETTKSETINEGDKAVAEEPISEEEKKSQDVSTLNSIQEKYPDVTLDVFESKKSGTISLGKIEVPKAQRGEGIATNVMSDLINYADANGLKITLTPSNEFGASKARLKEFYKRFGFVDNKGENRDFSHKDDMYRNPEVVVSESKETAQEQSGVKPKSVISETQGLTPKQQFKQGISEYVSALRNKERGKREELIAKSKENLDKVKERLTERINKAKDDNSAKNFAASTVQSLMDNSNLKGFSKSAMKKLLTKVKQTDRKNLGNIIGEAVEVVDNAVRAQRLKDIKGKSQKRAIKKVNKGKVGMNQEVYSGALAVDPYAIPNTEEGDVLLFEIEALYSDIINEQENLDDLKSRAKEIEDKYSKIAEDNTELISAYWENKEKGDSKAKTISTMLSSDKITLEQAEQLNNLTLKKPVEATNEDGEYSEKELAERSGLITSILENFPTYKTKAALIEKVNKALKLPIDALSDALYEKSLNMLDTKDLKEISKSVSSLKYKDLTSLKSLSSLMAADKEIKLGDDIKDASPRRGITDFIGWLKKPLEAKKRRLFANPVSEIDRVLGVDLGNIYDTVFRGLANAESDRTSIADELLGKLSSYADKIANQKDAALADMRMFYTQLHREFEANQDRKDVVDASESFSELKEALFGTSKQEDLQKVAEEFDQKYVEDGVINFDKIEEDMSAAEKGYLKTRREEVTPEVEGMGRVVTSSIRGEAFNPLAEYISHTTNSPKSAVEEVANTVDKAMDSGQGITKPSSKAGTLKERVSNPNTVLMPSMFSADARMINQTVKDYTMTLPLKSVSKLMRNLENKYREEKDLKALKNLELVRDVLKETIKRDLVNSEVDAGNIDFETWGKLNNYAIKKGYQYTLGTPVRAAAELASNLAYTSIIDPKAMINGMNFISTELTHPNKEKRNNKLTKMAEVLHKVQASQSSRLLGKEIASIWAEAGAFKGSKPSNKISKAIDKASESLLKTPDLLTAQAAWFGKFANEYKSITGNDFKLDTFSEAVYQKNKKAFDEAARKADDFLSDAVASNNPYTGVIASMRMPTDNVLTIYDKFLTRFMRFERAAFSKGLNAALKGEERTGISRNRGLKMMGASMARQSIYTAAMSGAIGALSGIMFGGDDEDDGGIVRAFYKLGAGSEKERRDAARDIAKELGAFALNMTLGSLGNVQKGVVNLGVEFANMEFGEGITRDKGTAYSMYDHGIAYSPINPNFLVGRPMQATDVSFLAGAGSGLLKQASETVQNASKYAQTGDEKYADKLLYRNLPALMGSATGLPIKDLERIGNRYLYGDKKDKKKYVEDLMLIEDGYRSVDVQDIDIPEIDVDIE